MEAGFSLKADAGVWSLEMDFASLVPQSVVGSRRFSPDVVPLPV